VVAGPRPLRRLHRLPQRQPQQVDASGLGHRRLQLEQAFHVFTAEQLAGDQLPGATEGQKIASATTAEPHHRGGGAQEKEYRAKYAAPGPQLSSVWMAATLGCAECHNHKYDPYTQKDFYSLAAFFADVRDAVPARPGRRTGPTTAVPPHRLPGRRAAEARRFPLGPQGPDRGPTPASAGRPGGAERSRPPREARRAEFVGRSGGPSSPWPSRRGRRGSFRGATGWTTRGKWWSRRCRAASRPSASRAAADRLDLAGW